MMDLTGPESRYARQELITWWEQARLRDASVLVVGAGALGNELVKDLALVGVGFVAVIDMDTVERSNLSRCVFFTESDEGRPKAEVVAEAARRLNPEIDCVGVVGDVTRQGLGWIARFDLVIGGLDNREARVFVNQACRKLSIPWIDGAIEGLRGTVRTFLPEGPCYECTLSETDRQILSQRRSCALLSEEEMVMGKVPTTATSASIVAAVQVQEAVRLLHGEGRLANEGWTFIGETLDTWTTSYGEDEYCLAHDRYPELRTVQFEPDATLASSISDALSTDGLSSDEVIAVDFEGDVVLAARCPTCDEELDVNRRLVDITRSDVTCPSCKEVMALDTVVSVEPGHPLVSLRLSDLGLPDLDVVTVRTAAGRVHLLLEKPR